MHFQPIQFGGRIRKLRREHHLTQERLAVMLNISVEHLRKIELGKRGIFCYQCLIKSTNRESIFYFARCRYGKTYC